MKLSKVETSFASKGYVYHPTHVKSGNCNLPAIFQKNEFFYLGFSSLVEMLPIPSSLTNKIRYKNRKYNAKNGIVLVHKSIKMIKIISFIDGCQTLSIQHNPDACQIVERLVFIAFTIRPSLCWFPPFPKI